MADLLRHREPTPAKLRTLLDKAMADRAPLVLPGCYDALGARLIEQAEFDLVYMTGFGTTAGLLGRPDVGLLGLSEMVDNARRIVDAVQLPVVADADTGYGNAINVVRTVSSYEAAGVAGIHLEDQVMPKRCGHMDGKQVVDRAEFVSKIRAAAHARSNPDFVLIARTDARAPLGLDEAVARAEASLDAGADVLFVEALETDDEIAMVAERFAGTPLVFNWAEGGKTPPLTYDQVGELGFAMILMPIGTLLAATAAMRDFLTRLKREGTPAAFGHELLKFGEFTDLIGLPEVQELEQRFGVS